MNPLPHAAKQIAIVVGLILLAGCSRAPVPEHTLRYDDLLDQMIAPERIARLDVPGSQIVTSYDRSGGNDDYSNPVRQGPAGWCVLADLEGPGYVTRLWLTGGKGHRRLRFYFDSERSPRINTTLDEFCGGQPPFGPPLAAREPYCWFTFLPMSYRERLVIMAENRPTGSDINPKLYYQVNYCSPPPDTTVETFPRQFSPEQLDHIAEVNQIWAERQVDFSQKLQNGDCGIVLSPGQKMELLNLKGAAILRELTICPDLSGIEKVSDREHAVQDLVLRIYWDDSEQASVEVPLGSFCGSPWRRCRYRSTYFGMTNNTFYSRFPMPFETTARIELENTSSFALSVTAAYKLKPLTSWSPHWGYFHTVRHKTGPQRVGTPHPILRTSGKGKYVGCLLATLSMDKSWWMLEGDEYIRVDNETMPSWHGTGLEDYFNAGWYYGNALTRAFHGIPFKAPFRTIQYRIHQVDPVLFNTNIIMQFERGPDNASHGWMESVAYYYLDTPQPVHSGLHQVHSRRPPKDPAAPTTAMTEINNMERLGDYQAASDYISAFLEELPDFPFATVLRARQIGYEERNLGFNSVRELYTNFLAENASEIARKQIEQWLWYHADPAHAILGVYCNTRTRVILDGKAVAELNDQEGMHFYNATLEPGKHVFAIQTAFHPYPDWVQVCLRTHAGDIVTDGTWKYAFNAAGNWANPDFDDSNWEALGGLAVKGPPEAPYVWCKPNIFVDMQSKAGGVRAGDWPDKNGYVVYRKVFDLAPADALSSGRAQ